MLQQRSAQSEAATLSSTPVASRFLTTYLTLSPPGAETHEFWAGFFHIICSVALGMLPLVSGPPRFRSQGLQCPSLGAHALPSNSLWSVSSSLSENENLKSHQKDC